jgi:hypothetical protein
MGHILENVIRLRAEANKSHLISGIACDIVGVLEGGALRHLGSVSNPRLASVLVEAVNERLSNSKYVEGAR